MASRFRFAADRDRCAGGAATIFATIRPCNDPALRRGGGAPAATIAAAVHRAPRWSAIHNLVATG
ncbi:MULTISPECIES: hypothetical protein [unclassified Sphingopyxis]|uniref:hypothetical protein n=1 Tax=unclassified Sphingopyxis TaxID=2614943 RepID=UPI0028588D0E|nr:MULTISPECIES: hypothetical protein [unclassified Sphingopyxis]MDR6834491.1 hypothetical protein [Sphingopyxis sp. BE122]MDR7226761.1 hypothetical protein [Sphingopyxis sp. BE259]